MINTKELMAAQQWAREGRIWQDWREGLPGPVTLRRVVPIVDAYEGPEFDAVWMVLALQAALPRRVSFRGTVTIGQAGAAHTNFDRLRKAVVAARNGDRDRLLRHLVDIAKAYHQQQNYRPQQLKLRSWAQDTAAVLSGDPDKVAVVCQRWAIEYTKAALKQRDGAEASPGQDVEEKADEHA